MIRIRQAEHTTVARRRRFQQFPAGLVAISSIAAVPTVVAPEASAEPFCPPEERPCIDPRKPPGRPNDDEAAVREFRWDLIPRFDSVWDSWDETTRTYDHDLVDPDRWDVRVSACTSGGRTVAFTSPRALSIRTRSWCSAIVSFPAEGTYDVTATARDRQGRTDAETTPVTVDDQFIVALGDSAASGEGNPDKLAESLADSADWQHGQCNRSKRSGITRAAEGLESRRRTVTFVNLACSGAEIDTGMLGPYDGISPIAPSRPFELPSKLPPLQAQLDVLHGLVCGEGPQGCLDRRPRHPDAVIVSVGINDIKMSQVLSACADYPARLASALIFGRLFAAGDTFPGGCSDDPRIETTIRDGLDQLETKAGELASRLNKIAPGADVYMTEYPDDLFHGASHGKGCGIFEEVDPIEAAWAHYVMKQLNQRIRVVTTRYNWHYIGGIAEDFRANGGHGYCSGEQNRWFVTLSESLANQHGVTGTVHPNSKGHSAIAKRVRSALTATKPEPLPSHPVTVTFEAVRVSDQLAKDPSVPLTFTFGATTFDGQVWTEKADAATTLTLPVDPARWVTLDPPPRLDTSITTRQGFAAGVGTQLPGITIEGESEIEPGPRPPRSLGASMHYDNPAAIPTTTQTIHGTAYGATIDIRFRVVLG